MKGLVVLGSTGSIGTQTLDVVRSFPDHFRVIGLAARGSLSLLESQAREFRPEVIYGGTEEEKASILSSGYSYCEMEEMVSRPDVDLVMAATAGDVGLAPTIAAIKARKNVALANKEPMVMAGGQIMELVREHDVELLPVDSEPNAIWQCLRGEDKKISKLILTASGGAFRDATPEQLTRVTPEQALDHPTWSMGPKITIDSATLMNKAFEVIEAHWLFGVPWENIEVVIHPQSIIHSMVEFVDGSVKAQISPPDMRLPIHYALFYPERVASTRTLRFDAVATGELTFRPWDAHLYPCFQMALEVAMRGGTWPAALSGADEMAVERFLTGRIGFLEIFPLIEEAIIGHEAVMDPSIDDLLAAAAWAKDRVAQLTVGG